MMMHPPAFLRGKHLLAFPQTVPTALAPCSALFGLQAPAGQAGETKQGFKHSAKPSCPQWGTGDTTGAAPGREARREGRAASGCLQPGSSQEQLWVCPGSSAVPAGAGHGREKALLVLEGQQLGWAAGWRGKCSWGEIPWDAAALHAQAMHCRERGEVC